MRDRTEAVRISRIQYTTGATDLLSLLQLQSAQLAAQAAVIQLRNAQFANRINLYLTFGGSFEPEPPSRYVPRRISDEGGNRLNRAGYFANCGRTEMKNLSLSPLLPPVNVLRLSANPRIKPSASSGKSALLTLPVGN